LLLFSDEHFEKRRAATCRFSKECCKNPENVPINVKKGIKINTD
jgi:hypothetical protein